MAPKPGKAWTRPHPWWQSIAGTMRFPCLRCLAFGLLGANGAGRKPGIPGFGALPEYVPEAHAADGAEGSQQQAAPPPQQSGALSESQQQQMMQLDKVLSDDKDDEQLMPLIDAVSALPGGLLMLKNAIKEESNVDPELHSELSSIVSMGGGSGALMKQPFWARLFALEGSEGEASPVDSPGPVGPASQPPAEPSLATPRLATPHNGRPVPPGPAHGMRADRDACARHRWAAACSAGEEEHGCPRVLGPA